MKRDEAIRLIGTRVTAWTAANGSYVGTLVRVTDSRPWRGVVKIDGVTDVPAFEYGRRMRRGFRPGEEIEVGGVNIRPTDERGTTYAEALEHQIAVIEEWHRQKPQRLWEDTLKQMRDALEREGVPVSAEAQSLGYTTSETRDSRETQ